MRSSAEPKKTEREWRKKSDWSDAMPKFFWLNQWLARHPWFDIYCGALSTIFIGEGMNPEG